MEGDLRLGQQLTCEAHAAGADVSAGHVLAGASIHAGVGFTLIVVDVAVFTTPAGVTQAFIADRRRDGGAFSALFSLILSFSITGSNHEFTEDVDSVLHWNSLVDLVLAVAVDAGVAQTLVDLGEAGGVVVAVRTHAGEAVDAVDAGAAVVARVDGALVDADVAHGSCDTEGEVFLGLTDGLSFV